MHEIIEINLNFFVTAVLEILQILGRTPRTNFHAFYPKHISDEENFTSVKIICVPIGPNREIVPFYRKIVFSPTKLVIFNVGKNQKM